MKFATAFGASKASPDSKEYNDGIKIGRFLSKKGYVVKCGGYQGLMEAVSRGVKEEGGICIGITLKKFDSIRPQNPYLSKRVSCNSLFERLQFLIEDTSLFIVQNGSIGTLNELFMVWAIKYGNLSDFRICLVSENYEELKHSSFIKKEQLDLLEFYKDADDFIIRNPDL
ncbi:LOG family protein [Nitrosophilus alvini]|uniref:LOG family protein n=1 Tax=Nitrosophilus alvini TaxID=2714855 RepID=UPI001909A6FD|nr:LOG family protein [Nitrosophilus alvini]